jgi:hypothetical protein
MMDALETIPLDDVQLPEVNRPRLARYLELPSVAQIDPVTDAEVQNLDDRRDELLSIWQRAVVAPVDRAVGSSIELGGEFPPIDSTDAYVRQLVEHEADTLVVAAFTIGGRLDEVIKGHLAREEVYEAYVLKQWGATMTEQARLALTRALQRWAQRRGRSLLPYDGPGYNGWPLTALQPLLELIYGSARDSRARPIRATDSGVLLPTNSMVIVCGITPHCAVDARDDERLAQCHRCAMRNCRYRTAPTVEVGV